MNPDDIAYSEIHPTVGVARVGNSPAFFIGPEAPGVRVNPPGGFKDSEGRVKRQAARFRVYAFDKDHNVLGELSATDARVEWSVELSNTKGAWFQFHGRHHQSDAPQNLRNQHIDPTDRQARAALAISPGPRSVSGPDAGGLEARFDTGTFLGTPVPLGELRTDEAGRLLVLGGSGHAASTKASNPLSDYANNDSWYDDISDGPVTATVSLAGGRAIPVTSAWVIAAPPDFSPHTQNLVTLYDVALEVAEGAGWLPRTEEVSFTRDIHPLLERVSGYSWVSANALRGHGRGERFGAVRPGDFLDPNHLERLASNSPQDAPFRNAVFSRLRTPGAEDVTQANYAFMPQLAGDDGAPIGGKPCTWFTLLPGQYERMRRWAAGDFDADATSPADPAPLADLPVADQPHALVRAALEACVGGPFFPGVEMTFIADEKATWAGPFRLRADLKAGDVTKYLAVPWHAAFYEGHTHWWPAQRPDDVLPEDEYRRLIRTAESTPELTELHTHRRPWARGVGSGPVFPPEPEPLPGESGQEYEHRVKELWERLRRYAGSNEMVVKWSRLGFVTAHTSVTGETMLVETERAERVGLSDREWFYVLQHPTRFPQQAEAAGDYVKAVLNEAVAEQNGPMFPLALRPFSYSREALDARLELIYSLIVERVADYDPATDFLQTYHDVVERIRQYAPFNLLDGAWLRNIAPTGPINEVQALLFSIWADEIGGGDPALNHSNLYSDLLHSVGLYLPPVDSYEFAMLPEMLDSAYTASVFQLAVSQHTEEFFPEVLGMTLWLEWTVLEIAPVVKLFEHHGVNPQFYRMHIGIDNAAAGHGAKAREAVVKYLEEVYDRGGEEAVQQQWQRIWNGYIAFLTVGFVGQELQTLITNPPGAEERLLDLIERKAPYASRNHDGKRLGDNMLNDWFADPPGLLRTLRETGMIQAGDPEHSPFFALTAFTGPMYKVFTDSELDLWREWTHSLAAPSPPAPALTPLEAMIRLVDTLRPRQSGNAAHARIRITGPDPVKTSRSRSEPVAWWFTQPTEFLLAALAHPDNSLVRPGHPEQSAFEQLIAPTNAMGRAFAAVVPGTGRTGHEVTAAWVTAGCPLPDLQPPVMRDLLSMPFRREMSGAERRPKIYGMGTVH
ncbi:LodA/GoxA family CTQ-dependent oxidase [Streptomyces sp. MS2.AVA.5]|uniref:LodA/GoxA family CTQ-dependent oxidase n=1 Tax=Streptomyces achmelvichensis TaxID=3134111 RepID=A0ACC6PM46_9ACTN